MHTKTPLSYLYSIHMYPNGTHQCLPLRIFSQTLAPSNNGKGQSARRMRSGLSALMPIITAPHPRALAVVAFATPLPELDSGTGGAALLTAALKTTYQCQKHNATRVSPSPKPSRRSFIISEHSATSKRSTKPSVPCFSA
jgi:hypothetical protein